VTGLDNSRCSDHVCMGDGERVLGVDGCKAGWVGVVLTDGEPSAYVAAQIDDLVAIAEADGRLDVVAIDMPVGLPDRGRRQADVLARAAVGQLWQSVFMTPVRAALQAPDHASAVLVNQELAGKGISSQAFALRPKLRQVEHWVLGTGHRVYEVHPEVCFARLAGAPLVERKSTWAGAVRRRRLLATAGITLPDDLGAAGRVAAVDDVLDAAVAAWTARRIARGEAQPMPNPPELFSDGLPCAIWS
jgi:predicted RNase H-like nuclease